MQSHQGGAVITNVTIREQVTTAVLGLGSLFLGFLLALWIHQPGTPKPAFPDTSYTAEPEDRCSRPYNGLRFADCPLCPGTICGIPVHGSPGALATLQTD